MVRQVFRSGFILIRMSAEELPGFDVFRHWPLLASGRSHGSIKSEGGVTDVPVINIALCPFQVPNDDVRQRQGHYFVESLEDEARESDVENYARGEGTRESHKIKDEGVHALANDS